MALGEGVRGSGDNVEVHGEWGLCGLGCGDELASTVVEERVYIGRWEVV